MYNVYESFLNIYLQTVPHPRESRLVFAKIPNAQQTTCHTEEQAAPPENKKTDLQQILRTKNIYYHYTWDPITIQ